MGIGTWMPRILLSMLALGSLPVDVANADQKGKSLEQRQKAYSKQLYEEGVAAMDAKQFDAALTKFQEAYRYAPELHLFTYNIASAADAAGQCQMAMSYYQMFLDLVPEHPSRDEVRGRLEELSSSCTVSHEAVELPPTTPQRRDEPPDSVALHEALAEMERSIELYKGVLASNPEAKAFQKVLKRKKRHHERLLELFDSHGIERHEIEVSTAVVPDNLGDACERAAGQEGRNVVVYDKVLEQFDSREMSRVIRRFRWLTQSWDRPKFEGCAK